MGRLVCIGCPRRRRGIESIGMVCMTSMTRLIEENRFDFAWATFRDGYLSRAYLSWLIEQIIFVFKGLFGANEWALSQ